MRMGLKRFFSDERGANAVEFALVAAPFLLLLFGTVEFGRMFWSSHAIHQVAISTARCIALPQQECRDEIGASAQLARAFAQQGARNWFVPLTADAVVIETNTTCRSMGLSGFVQVEITHDFSSAVPGLISALAGSNALRASACFPRQV